MFRLYSLIIHKAAAKRAITGRQTLHCSVMRSVKRKEVETLVLERRSDLYECCYMLMVPGHNWRWGWTEITRWTMRRWCIDTLIKGKLRLRPFGCCGFDERGLSDSTSTCRYGRSFWWLTLWKDTQHQCRVTALIFTLPRLPFRWNLKSWPSLFRLQSRRSWKCPNQFFPSHGTQRLHFIISVSCKKLCGVAFCIYAQNQMESDDFDLLNFKADLTMLSESFAEKH